MERSKTEILEAIKNTLQKVLPQEGKAYLYGSQARGDAREDSDWDILIVLDKNKIETEDFDNISYPLVELGWSFHECISPVLYTLKDWMKYHFTPFFHNVEEEGIQLV